MSPFVFNNLYINGPTVGNNDNEAINVFFALFLTSSLYELFSKKLKKVLFSVTYVWLMSLELLLCNNLYNNKL